MKLLILNPTAGHGRSAEMEEKIKALLPDCELVRTERPGHATALAAEAAKSGKYDAVVAVGGDGTVSEVAAGLRGTDIPLGILPAGTGNDACRGYHIPLEMEEAVKVLQQGKVRAVDTMKVDDTVYLNITSVGFDAQVVKNAERFKRFGAASYAMGVFATLLGYHSTGLRLTVDDDVLEGRYYLAAVGCGTHYGGGMNVLPNADPCDGQMDLCTIDPVNFLKVIRLLPAFMKGKHGKLPIVRFRRVRHMIFEALDPEGYDLNMDGEVRQGIKRTEITVLPEAQKVIMPE